MLKSSLLKFLLYFTSSISIIIANEIFSNSNWNDLRITWGSNPFSPTSFVYRKGGS